MDLGYQSDSSDKEEPFKYAVPYQTFDSLKELGNQLFKQTFQDNALSMTEYQQQMCQALQHYSMAHPLAKNNKEISSIRKNMAVSQFHILIRMAQCNPQNSAQMTKEFKYYMEESLGNFDEAIKIGRLVQKPWWIRQMTEKQSKCAELMWNFLILLYGKGSSCILLGHLHKLCTSANEPSLYANLFLKLLNRNRLSIEEAKRNFSHLEEATELEESTYTHFNHLSVGDSAKARRNGDHLQKGATCQEEEVQMELTCDAIDCYLQFIVSSRSKDPESEAMASQLGRLYELMLLNEKSREHYKFTIQLATAMHPKMDKFQTKQEWDERKEKEAIRAPIRIELKKVLDELRKASKQSAQYLLNFIYAKYPPKRGTKSTDPTIRARYKMALLHYHPDKQDPEEHGLKWIVLSEEITVLLTNHFERMKSDPELENTFEQEDSCSESDDSSHCEAEDFDWETDSWETQYSWETEDSDHYCHCQCHECHVDEQETGSCDTTQSEDWSDSEQSEDDISDFQDFTFSNEPAEEYDYFAKCDCAQKLLDQKDPSKNYASTDMQHWKESGFSGSFFSIKCRSLRIGSYQFTSVDRVLFSPEGLMVRAPVLNSQETSKLEWISLNLPMHLLLQVETHFDQDLLVIFLLCAPSLCRKVSAELRLKENGEFWDSLSMEKSQRLLTLLPCCLDDSVKKAIKETFSCPSTNMLHEITTFEAHKTLLLSSPSQD